ncbi:MAG: pyridoxamine 5'-phosphate oxidase family protein [Acidimicrobiales bacterium]
MALSADECWARLRASAHGVLATVHPQRGADAVPVVFVTVGDRVVVPIDTVKRKRDAKMQRIVNLERDARCVLLVDHYAEDWSALWWVRVHATAIEVAPTPEVVALLAEKYPDYAAAGSIASTIVLTPTAVRGWAAA